MSINSVGEGFPPRRTGGGMGEKLLTEQPSAILIFHLYRENEPMQHAISYQKADGESLTPRQSAFIENTDKAILAHYEQVKFVGAFVGTYEQYEDIYTQQGAELFCPACQKNTKGQ